MAQSHPPLKRHVALRPFSRDHYVGLVQAQHLMKSAAAGPEARRKALSEFLAAWDDEIAAHFADEERLLLGLLPDDQRRRLLSEHAALTGLAAEAKAQALQAEPDAAWVNDLGNTLNGHIRWEERELFPSLEASATSAQLADLEAETSRVEATRPRNVRLDRGRQRSQDSGSPGGGD